MPSAPWRLSLSTNSGKNRRIRPTETPSKAFDTPFTIVGSGQRTFFIERREGVGGVVSTFISRGTSKVQIFMYAAGCCSRTFSIASAPCFLKSAASASRKSLLKDLRVASKDPPGLLAEQMQWMEHQDEVKAGEIPQ